MMGLMWVSLGLVTLIFVLSILQLVIGSNRK